MSLKVLNWKKIVKKEALMIVYEKFILKVIFLIEL